MQDKDRIIAQQTTGGRIATEEGYARLEMLMRGNEAEQQQKDRYLLVAFVVVCLAVFWACIDKSTEEDKIKTQVALQIDQYVRQNYGDEFDKFEKGGISDFGYNGEQTYLSQSYYEKDYPEYPRCSFSIKSDLDGNIVFDGYQQDYLTGGSLYNHLSSEYSYPLSRELDRDFYAQAIQQEHMTMLDNASVHIDFIDQYEWDLPTDRYTGPKLDPTRHDSVDELAAQYGYITVKLNTVSDDLQTFERLVNFFRDFINSRDVVYNHVNITMNPKADIQENYKVTLTYDEITSPDFTAILAEKLAVYAQD